MVKVKHILDEFIEGSKLFGELISVIINSLLLTFVYFIGVGLTSISGKIFGKQFVYNKSSKKNSYWEELNLTTHPFKEYYRQF